MTKRAHVVSIVAGGVQIRDPITYDISTSITDAVDQFQMRFAFTRAAWDALVPDRPLQVLIDGVPVLSGFIDDSDAPEDEHEIAVSGRSKIGRLVDDAAPRINFAGLGIRETVAKLAHPFFSSVSMSNARNRAAIRGRGKKARSSDRPRSNSRVGTRVEPGQTRWSVISDICEQAGYLAWGAGNGTELIVGQPNYTQGVQFRFFRPAPASSRARKSSVMGMGVRRSKAERYDRVVVVGSGVGTDANYGAPVSARRGEARAPSGEFSAEKTLVVQRSVASAAEAQEFAEAEMARRDAKGHTVPVRAEGHGQGGTLFACDTLADVEDERTGTRGVYVISACSFSAARGEGEVTTMTLVKKGSVLSR